MMNVVGNTAKSDVIVLGGVSLSTQKGLLDEAQVVSFVQFWSSYLSP